MWSQQVTKTLRPKGQGTVQSSVHGTVTTASSTRGDRAGSDRHLQRERRRGAAFEINGRVTKGLLDRGEVTEMPESTAVTR